MALINGVVVVVANRWIGSCSDFASFVRYVNNGDGYEWETIYLTSDIDLSCDGCTTIGNDEYFLGTFDGQGHVIRNLKISSSSSDEYFGMFGYSNGLTIKNVVLDSSCSFTSTHDEYAYVGGVVGRCCASEGPCIIENVVNMGSISFSGNAYRYSYLGGIAGSLESSSSGLSNVVKNCANYGPVTHQGTSGTTYMGGIVGYSRGESAELIYLQNCLNYGTLTNDASSGSQRVGGIVGQCWSNNFESCVSTGKINLRQSTTGIGGVVGYVTSSSIKNCFLSSGVGKSNLYGSYSGVSVTDSSYTPSLDSSTLNKLNGYSGRDSTWNKWFTIYLYEGAINNVNQNTPPVMHTYFPDPTREGYNFAGWYTESWYANQYNPQSANINSLSGVYAKWSPISYTISFDSNGGSSCSSITQDCGTNIYLPKPTKNNYDFYCWCSDYGLNNRFTESTMPPGGAKLYAKWTPKLYTITFNSNGGSSCSSITKGYGTSISLPTPKRTGYSFMYWCSDSGLNSRFTASSMPSGGATLYAKWSINKYTLTFVFGNGDDNEVRTLYFDTQIDYPEGFSKTGYTFSEWDNEPEKMPGNDTIITALWTPNNYTVIFDGNSGIPSQLNKSVTYDNAYGELPNGTKTGYILTGWFTEEDEKIESITQVKITGPQTLYARWVIGNYTLVFDFDNGAEPENRILKFNSSIVYPTNVSKIGYTFSEWDNVLEVMPGNDITITALWTPNNYTVTFDPMGGDISIARKNVTYDSTYGELPEPTKTGHSFSGWFTEEGNGDEVTNETEVNITEAQILYAHWDINNYTLTFNFANDEEDDVRILTFNEIIEYPENISKIGYTFSKWDSVPGVMPGNDITITALWTPNKYNVTFNPMGGNVDQTSKNVTYDSTYGDLPIPTMIGYGFDGWFTEEVGGEEIESDNEVNTTGDRTLYAHWTAGSITVTFDPTGGISDKLSKTTFFDETYGDLPEPTRTGHTFAGWFSEDNGGGNKITNETEVKNPNHHILYAHWAINQYTITFEVNGGSKCEPITQDYNTLIVFSEIKKTGYTFLHWCSDPELDIEYTETTVPAEDITLYAKWAINKYTLVFIFDNGTNPEEETLDYDEIIEHPENVSRVGYTFDEWDKDIGKMPASDLNITALWVPNEYTVTFDVNSGNPLSEPEITKEITYDSTYGDFPDASKEGYSFLGWFTEAEGGVRVESTAIVKITMDKTLYAKWIINNYTLTFVLNDDDSEEEVFEFDEIIDYPEGVEKTGYTFEKWDKELERMPANDATITALWVPNKYSVVFNGNNGIPSRGEKEVTYDSTYGDLPEASRTGYSFLGWYTEEGKEIKPTTEVKITNKQTLYAHWIANKYIVVFDVNGGNPIEQAVNVTYDSTYGDLPEASREGHTFIGWTEKVNGNEINGTTIVKVPNDHTLYAIWLVNKYSITFMLENGTAMSFTLPFNTTIPYPNDIPSKVFYSFRKWCSKDESGIEICDLAKVPARNLTFTASFDVDSSLVTGTTVSIAAGTLFIILIIVVVLLVLSLIEMKKKSEFIELDELDNYGRDDELTEERILQQVKATKISDDLTEKISECLMKVDKAKPLEEILADLEVDYDEGAIGVVESFQITPASASVAGSIQTGTRLIATTEFLVLLYTAVREQEVYEEFEELYFGMKDIENFMDKKDCETISFGGVISGFTNKRRAIQSLFSREKNNSALNGVLFKVQNAKGYRIGKAGDEVDEVLFELGSVFKVESVKEIAEKEFISVSLSLISPASENDFIKF